MTYPRYIDLNIGNTVLTHLTVDDALKEIISNAFDEHITSEVKKNIRIYKNDNDNWCIRDYGRGLSTNNFKFDKNDEKEANDDLIGFFGYGLKDAIAIMNTNKIKFKIYTKRYIYTPMLKSRQDFPDEQTIHIEVIRNTTYEIRSGTEFIFDNLENESMSLAKNKFIEFLKPKILSEISGYKIFKLDTFQSIFVNGVEVYKNTGFHFSYDIKSSENIRQCFNRDRKQLDLSLLKKHISRVLKSLDIINDDKDEIFNNIRNILKVSTREYLQEFSQIDVLRNIITQINSLNKYVFVGSKEKLTKKLKEKIKDDNKEVFILGDGVKSKFNVKFNVKSIKDLYHKENFYKDYDEDTLNINTLMNYIDPPIVPDITDYISNIIKPIEKLFKIPEELKQKLLNIEVVNCDDNKNSDEESTDDESTDDGNDDENIDIFEKHGYDFSGEKLKLSNKYINEKMKKDLFVILFRYIVETVDDDILKTITDKMGDKLGDKPSGQTGGRKYWNSWW